jgi:uncharacterized protein
MGYFLRLLIIALAVWLAVQLLRRALRPARRAGERPPAGNVPRMLPCAYCGVHVPESEAVRHDGRVYCSREHVALEERRR